MWPFNYFQFFVKINGQYIFIIYRIEDDFTIILLNRPQLVFKVRDIYIYIRKNEFLTRDDNIMILFYLQIVHYSILY